MTQLNNLANRLLRLEQQLTAYQKLHTDELAELWRILEEYKRALVIALHAPGSDGYLKDPLAADEELRGKEG